MEGTHVVLQVTLVAKKGEQSIMCAAKAVSHIGFTGIRDSSKISETRLITLKEKLTLLAQQHDKLILHHGDCIGMDQIAHNLACELGYGFEIHPPINNKYRAYCAEGITLDEEHKVHPQQEYIRRNHAIVVACSILIAVPAKSKVEEIRSGTWSTIRFARLNKKECMII